ncbi:MAG: ABC transporter permease, partial [Anaerolineae bacterium]|nr:ABC transporter permease [Anaerolineae bacterium]
MDSVQLPYRESRGLISQAMRRFAHNKGAVVGLLIILGLLFAIGLAPYLAPYPPLRVVTEDMLQGPNPRHLMGTDEIGRDVLSRVIFGGRLSVVVGIMSISIAGFFGMILG